MKARKKASGSIHNPEVGSSSLPRATRRGCLTETTPSDFWTTPVVAGPDHGGSLKDLLPPGAPLPRRGGVLSRAIRPDRSYSGPILWNGTRALYIRSMTSTRPTSRIRRSRGRAITPPEVFVPKRVARGRKPHTMQLQWYDGAGELQYAELSPAQSWPYLREGC